MFGVVEPQASHRLHMRLRQGGEQQAHANFLVRHIILAKDIALDDTCSLSFGNVTHSLRQDGIAVICAAILGQEADETLSRLG